MFEIKIEDVLESKETPEERDFLKQARRLQICDTIESLSDVEFVELQRSVHQVFMKVSKLQDIVKDGIEKGEAVRAIRSKLKKYYLESLENSFYYREQYLTIENFLADLEEKNIKMSNDSKEIAILKCKFLEVVEQPNLSFQNTIQSAIYSREDIKKRIYSRDSQLEGTKDLAELCHGIRKELSVCLKDKANSISTMQILDGIVIPFLEEYQDISLSTHTIETLEKNLKMPKKVSMLGEEKDILDMEVQELIEGLQKKFDLEQIQEVIDFVEALIFGVDSSERERIEKVVKRLKEIQNSSSVMLWIGKNTFRKEIIDILNDEQKYSHERRKNNKVQDNTQEKEDKRIQNLITEVIQKELVEGYVAEGENQLLTEVIRSQDVQQAIELLQNLKIHSNFRKFFADFCLPCISLTNRLGAKKFIQEGHFDDAAGSIISKIEEKRNIFQPGKYNVNRVGLYEELSFVRNVNEEEILDALLSNKTMKKIR